MRILMRAQIANKIQNTSEINMPSITPVTVAFDVGTKVIADKASKPSRLVIAQVSEERKMTFTSIQCCW